MASVIGVFIEDVDPITGIITRDWAAVGGWSLFIALAMLVVIGFFREIIVPGARARRTEEALAKALDNNKALTEQNGQLITTNKLLDHYLDDTSPKIGTTERKLAANEGGAS